MIEIQITISTFTTSIVYPITMGTEPSLLNSPLSMVASVTHVLNLFKILP
jgi:hypothetical protein